MTRGDAMGQVQEVAKVKSNVEQRIPMTYAEFLEKFEDSTHVEWVKGEAIIFMPPSIRHQKIIIFLVTLLNNFVKVFDLGQVLTAPCEMRFAATNTSREPDILFLAKESYERLSENRLDGPADLVVEVISPESINRDRVEKFYEYQENGVREYWLIDPRTGLTRADFWVLAEDGRFRPEPIDSNGIYHSTVLPNFRLNVNSLFADELPEPIKALADMVGMDAMLRAMGREK
jgi:Uma2 family endonuclease